MKIQIQKLFISTCFVLLSCSQTENCPDKVNLLPMFGKEKKCAEQLKVDQEFIAGSDKNFKNRKDAAKYYIGRGWEYFYKNQSDTAMMRFNQAWLLDSDNADSYWGFGNLLGRDQKFKESLIYFDKSIKLNPENAKVWLSTATSNGQLFYQTKNITFLNTAIENLKKSVSIDNQNPEAFAQLTACYSYFMQKDSAKKYLDITDKLDPKAVNPEVRRIVNGN